MAHFKRGKSKDRRAGCLLCKPHKSNGMKDTAGARTLQEQRSLDSMKEELSSLGADEVLDDDWEGQAKLP